MAALGKVDDRDYRKGQIGRIQLFQTNAGADCRNSANHAPDLNLQKLWNQASDSTLVLPEFVKPFGCQLSVSAGVGNIPVAKIVLNSASVLSVVGQFKTACVS